MLEHQEDPQEPDWEAASEWAETAKVDPEHVTVGDEAAAAGRQMLQDAGWQPDDRTGRIFSESPPPGLELLRVETHYASEHRGHGLPEHPDPYYQETGTNRQLANVRVRYWRVNNPEGEHRRVERQVYIFADQWVESEDQEDDEWRT